MNGITITGLSISVIFFFLRYAIKDMRPSIAWLGVAFGFVLMFGGSIDMDSTQWARFKLSPSAYIFASLLCLVLASALGWRGYRLYSDGWPLKWTWGSFLLADYDYQKNKIRIAGFEGLVENASNEAVQLEDAYVTSGMDSVRFAVKMNDRYGKYLDPIQFQPLPVNSQRLDVRALFVSETGFIAEEEFWAKIGSLKFTAKYSGRTYIKNFSREDFREQLERLRPIPPAPYPATKD
ncbi:hypothetical protein [Rhodopseudomonas palustris]|uniref:hypothetical protein n=1 Tax=Rhodopseudomonas palustris TaxID=1076 RepID=UPI000ADE9179|nr:hypothetical protein [Rhodopseudomonas palustris]